MRPILCTSINQLFRQKTTNRRRNRISDTGYDIDPPVTILFPARLDFIIQSKSLPIVHNLDVAGQTIVSTVLGRFYVSFAIEFRYCV
jgi:hypothetical protein